MWMIRSRVAGGFIVVRRHNSEGIGRPPYSTSRFASQGNMSLRSAYSLIKKPIATGTTVFSPNVWGIVVLFRKRETVVSVAGFGFRFAATACGDDDVLAMVDFERCRRGVASSVELVFPQQLASMFVEGMKAFVHGSADEDETASCDERAADIEGASRGKAPGFKFWICSEWNLPADFPTIEVDGVENAPRTFVGGETFVIAEIVMASGDVWNFLGPTEFQIFGRNLFGAFFLEQKTDDGVALEFGKRGEAGHLVASGL